MVINYKKELESAAKGMILVHEPNVLIRLIVRIIVQKVKVSHAGILLHDKNRDTYILNVSRGPSGIKIPAGFARMDRDNPLIKFFLEHKYKEFFKDGAIIHRGLERAAKKKNIKSSFKRQLKQILYQMDMFHIDACIPSYFRDDLLGILLLGRKNNGREFSQEELDFFVALASDVAMAMRNAQLFQDLELALDKMRQLFVHTTVALAAAIEAKDRYTHGHTERVTNLSLAIANKLSQKTPGKFDKKFFDDIHVASLLHDIGKIGVPEHILNKQGPLTDEEMGCIHRHPMVGVNILQPIKELEDCILGIKYHHERYDGSGYPEGLRGEQIPLIASIIAVADAFDAMTTNRPYHPSVTKDEAVEEIMRLSGRQFHPEVVNAFVELYQEGRI